MYLSCGTRMRLGRHGSATEPGRYGSVGRSNYEDYKCLESCLACSRFLNPICRCHAHRFAMV
jgi:hypothetical protein